MTTYGFGNIGKRPGGPPTTRVDQDALHALHASLPNEDAVVFLCEINEGDDDNEMALVREAFKGWTLYAGTAGQQVREPILTSPDIPKCRARVTWVPDTAVRNWSPPRSLLTVHRLDRPESYLAMHYPAGAHGQGTRPSWAVPLLDHGWDVCRETHRRHELMLHSRGRDVVYMMDANDYALHLIVGEETVVHEHTDWGRVLPAGGSQPRFRSLPAVPFHIDSHDGQRMRGTFHRASA